MDNVDGYLETSDGSNYTSKATSDVTTWFSGTNYDPRKPNPDLSLGCDQDCQAITYATHGEVFNFKFDETNYS